MGDRFTEKQGQYLAFIASYLTMHRRAPRKRISSDSSGRRPDDPSDDLEARGEGIHQSVPGQARSIKLLVDPDEIPRLNRPE